MLVISPLPHCHPRRPPQPIHPSPRIRLEPPNNLRQPMPPHLRGGLILRTGRFQTGLFLSCPNLASCLILCTGRCVTGLFRSRSNGRTPQLPHGIQTHPRDHLPTHKHNNPMHVIRHHHKHIQLHMRVMLRQPLPRLFDRLPHRIQLHPADRDPTKQMLPPVRTNRHRIRPILRVVVFPQPPRSPRTLNPHRRTSILPSCVWAGFKPASSDRDAPAPTPRPFCVGAGFQPASSGRDAPAPPRALLA